MLTKSGPTAVTLLLSVHGGGDAFGSFFASLTLGKTAVERLLHRAAVHRAAHKLESELYQTTYFDYSPEFFESGWEEYDDIPVEDAEKLEEVFGNEDYPTDGIREAKPGEVPEQGTVRLDYSKLIITGSMSENRPDMVDYRWEACIKHTDVEISTAEIAEETVRALLGRLA